MSTRTISSVGTTILLASALAGCASGNKREGNERVFSLPKGYLAIEGRNLPKEGEPLERYVEREFSRHGKWVADYVDRNYSDDKKGGQVSLGVIEDSQKLQTGFIDTEAVYFPKRDLLCFVEKQGKSAKKMAELTHHELWHSIFDEEGVKGLVRQPGYKGPSVQEIEEFAKMMSSGRDFDILREGLDNTKEMRSILTLAGRLVSKYGDASKTYHKALSEISGEVRDGRGCNKYIEKDEASVIASQFEKLDIDGKALDKLLIEFSEWLKKKTTYMKTFEKENTIPRKNIREFYKHLGDFGERFKKYDKVPELSTSVRDNVVAIYERAEEMEFEDHLKELNGRIASLKNRLQEDGSDKQKTIMKGILKSKEEFRSDLHQQEKRKKDFRKLKKTVGKLGSFMSSLGKLQDLTLGFLDIRDKFIIDAILEDPDEIMARFFDSLFSFYSGPVTDKNFPLEEKHRIFFGRFEYKGQKMFERYIELSRIAEDILKGVEDTEREGIIKALKDADTIISPGGQRISTLVSPFRIDGKIPRADWVDR